MILSPSDLVALTRRDRPTAQSRILRLLGIPFSQHPIDGTLLVSRAAVERALGGPPGAVADVEQYDTNVRAIHGRTSSHAP